MCMLLSLMCEIESSQNFDLLRDEFDLIQKKLMSLSMRYQKSYWEAEEVVSETYLQAMQNGVSLRGAPSYRHGYTRFVLIKIWNVYVVVDQPPRILRYLHIIA